MVVSASVPAAQAEYTLGKGALRAAESEGWERGSSAVSWILGIAEGEGWERGGYTGKWALGKVKVNVTHVLCILSNDL